MVEDDQVQSDILLRELDYRREKQWKIFSWMASLLLAIVGGTLALKLGDSPRDFSTLFKIAITIAASGLQIYATVWIRQNWRLERQVLRELAEVGIRFPSNDRNESYLGERNSGLIFGYLQALFLVFIAVIAVVWISPDAA